MDPSSASAELRRLASSVASSPSREQVLQGLRRVLAAVRRAAGPKFVVKYYMSWLDSSGNDMDVTNPEYEELSRWNEEVASALQGQGLEMDAEDQSFQIYAGSAADVLKAVQAMEKALQDGASNPSPVISLNARESGLASVDPYG